MAGCLRVTHPFATRIFTEIKVLVRLACVKHAASVRPEPGSNSPRYLEAIRVAHFLLSLLIATWIFWLVSFNETRTLAYVHFFRNDYLSLFSFQRSAPCFQLSAVNWRLDYSIKFDSFRQALFQNIFEEVFNFESLPLCPSDFYYYRLFHLPRQPLNYINFTLSIYSTFTKHLILYLYIMNTQYRHILFSEIYYYIVIYFNISQSY